MDTNVGKISDRTVCFVDYSTEGGKAGMNNSFRKSKFKSQNSKEPPVTQ
jgi:hypothetical protein